MDIRYYDLLSTAIIGVACIAIVNYFVLGSIEVDGVVYLALGYIVGYFINSIGSLMESIYYRTIKGMPSDNLLTLVKGQNWTGYSRVKFYEAENVIELLKQQLEDQNASTRKMFGCAMRKVNACEDSRVPAFNAQYAWSRTTLTAVLIVGFICGFHYYDEWLFWVVYAALLILSWNRFKERGYYYAREVLNEYLRQSNLS